jgi:hypothetical protein
MSAAQTLSTRQAARKLGIPAPTLAHYIRVGKIVRPRSFSSGGATVHIWTKQDIENVRKLLPKIVNGRKTRWQRQRAAENKKQAKGKTKPPATVPAPHKRKRTKKKKSKP